MKQCYSVLKIFEWDSSIYSPFSLTVFSSLGLSYHIQTFSIFGYSIYLGHENRLTSHLLLHKAEIYYPVSAELNSYMPTQSASVATFNYAFCTSNLSHVTEQIKIPAECKQSAIIDCSTTSHFTPLLKILLNYWPVQNTIIKAANSHSITALGVVDLPIELPNGQSWTSAILKDVLYSPDLMFMLISISHLDRAIFTTTLENGCCTISSLNPNWTPTERSLLKSSTPMACTGYVEWPSLMHLNPVSMLTQQQMSTYQ